MSELVKYDWKITLRKGLKKAGLTLGAIAGVAVVEALQNPVLVAQVLGDHPLAVLAVPLVVGAATAFGNWLKNRKKGQ